MKKLLLPYKSQALDLKNHLVMAPMTRCRAIHNLPNALMASYYSQRSGAGLIIAEGTSPAPEGLGYARIPGIFSKEQVEGWKLTTAAVHQHHAKIFLQLMHTGRIGHPANLPAGAQVIGVSAIAAAGQMYTDTAGMQDYPVPVALTTQGVEDVIESHVSAAKNAIAAGFDGVELHAAHGYLVEQFLHPEVNNRTDKYGGSVENRTRFAITIAQRIADAIGKEKLGVRISPNATVGDLKAYDAATTQETYIHLSREFNRIGLAYVHVSLFPEAPAATLAAIRAAFKGTLIYCNGFTPETAEAALHKGGPDLIAFAHSFIANPDLDQHILKNAPLNEGDPSTFYSADAKGYTDYPALSQ
ncbi:N-ethylmaleimide reductase [Chitinophaga costaii]|uniref:N-ethylmaleimide reductase n=1 Tax=Chitinophaga costaii TaxID=1335309 RepID=A0A1C4EMA9_9BACT|nr:alkene reductase [Chitinophaga costaii]PUZ22444.1 alkene reductase [Chitinophaga costaii]SCC44748.1 N-ethylmaleimide reductase [Chitinophaga costaii]